MASTLDKAKAFNRSCESCGSIGRCDACLHAYALSCEAEAIAEFALLVQKANDIHIEMVERYKGVHNQTVHACELCDALNDLFAKVASVQQSDSEICGCNYPKDEHKNLDGTLYCPRGGMYTFSPKGVQQSDSGSGE